MDQRTNSDQTQLSINIEQESIVDEDLSEERDLLAYCLLQIIIERGFSPKHAQFAIDQIPQKHFHNKQFAELLDNAMKTLVSAPNSEQTIPTRPREKSIFETIVEAVNTQSPNIATYLEQTKGKSTSQQQLLQCTCQICLESYEQNGIIYQLDCDHQFCNTCFEEYCRSLIMNGSADRMMCPSVGCYSKISDEQLLKILSQEFYNKMIKFRNIKQLALDPDVIWCPNPECEQFVRQNKTKYEILECNCGQKICTKCHRQAHKQKSCSKSMDILYKKAVKKLKIQKCQKCSSPIQKDDGCNHMTCKQCHYEFCWLCQQGMTDNHYKSFNIFGCPGMQFSQRDPYSHPALTRFFYIMGFILLFPLFLLIGIISLIIGLPALIYMNSTPSKHYGEYSCCKKYCTIQLIIFACIIFMPLSFVVVCFMIIVGILGFPYFLYLFIRWICE